jgi:tight adherence protein C
LLPKAEAERTSIRGQLTYAGFRKPSAVPLFFGLKGVLAAVFPAIYGVLEAATDFGFKSPLFVTLVCALIGFYTPNRLLAARIRRRHDEIFRKLPDVMDLMIVCVEAGLGIDATLKKMAQELDVVSKLLAEEFRMLALELQAGLPRAQALQNLGDRNGDEALRNLTRVLVQTERFGGGIGATLRTYIEMMSSKRIQIANEAAGRASVKLSFPLVGCILPALWIILMGPAILRLIDALRGHQ